MAWISILVSIKLDSKAAKFNILPTCSTSDPNSETYCWMGFRNVTAIYFRFPQRLLSEGWMTIGLFHFLFDDQIKVWNKSRLSFMILSLFFWLTSILCKWIYHTSEIQKTITNVCFLAYRENQACQNLMYDRRVVRGSNFASSTSNVQAVS